MLSLRKNELAAALVCAAKGDMRHYLNGVLVERCENGDVHIVAADGHRLFCGKSQHSTKCDGNGPWRIIIPRDTVAQAVKGKGEVMLEALPNGCYTLGSQVFTAINGRFPDWRRFVSEAANATTEPTQFNWEYIADAQKALRLWTGTKLGVTLYPHGDYAPARLTIEDCWSAHVVVMSLKINGPKIEPFSPSEYEIVKEQKSA